jgi:hypothetical protein
MENRNILSLGTADKGLQIVAAEEIINLCAFDDSHGDSEKGFGAEICYTLDPTEAAKLRDFLDAWLMAIT